MTTATGIADPLDELTARIGPLATQAVDGLQVAALLEADGVNDRAAQVQYGFADVFALADAVHRRLGHVAAPPAVQPPRAWRTALRDLSRGVLYLMPSAAFPAALIAFDGHQVVAGLILAAGLGWVWAAGASWLAYQLLGREAPRAAGRLLCWAAGTGVLAGAGLGVAVSIAVGGGLALVWLAVGVLAYQMGSTLLMFHRRELWLAAAMAPAAAAGVAYLAVDDDLRPAALTLTGAGVVATLGLGIYAGWRVGAGAGDAAGVRAATAAVLSGQAMAIAAVLGYGALSAALLLHAQAPYLVGHLDVVLTALPLMASMGVVEWRARRFAEQARAALHRVRYPRQFVARLWLLLAGGLVTSMAAVAVLGALLLFMLRGAGGPSAAATGMAMANVVLAGAYFLMFILAGQGQYGWLCTAIAAAVAAHLAGVWLAGPGAGARVDVMWFLASTVLLQALLVAALGPLFRQVWRYR